MKQSLKLSLYNAQSLDNWTDECTHILQKQGMVVQKQERSKLIAWVKNDIATVNKLLGFIDAVDIHTTFLRPGRFAICMHPKRLYFHADNLDSPIRLGERKILGESNRPPVSAKALLEKTLAIAKTLLKEGVILPCSIRDSQTDELISTYAIGRNGRRFELSKDLWGGLRNSKVYYLPEQFEIILVHDADESANVVNDYIDTLVKEWLPELGIEDAAQRIRKIALENALAQMHEVKRGERSSSLQEKIFLVAISGKPGDQLPRKQKLFLQLLGSMRQQFRVFSYANRNLKWSSRSQAVSILQGAGGIPYRLMLPLPGGVDDCLFYGVDIGHDHTRSRVSRVAVSVTDQYGSHILTLWMHQKLNEAAASEALGNMLRKARQIASSETGSGGNASIVLRDGRIPNVSSGSGAESLETYFNSLGMDTTVVECRKRGNPMMYVDGQAPSIAPAGCACSPEDSDVRFVLTHDSSQGIASVLKLNIPEDGDGLSIGINTMSRIVTGLCYSPSLGLKPHLPGPIYWADGVGSTAPHSYKFKGQRAYEYTE